MIGNINAFVVELKDDPNGAGAVFCWPNVTVTTCEWDNGDSQEAGRYTIHVPAPGYQTVNFPVTLSFDDAGQGFLSPNTVVLTPGDGGT